ncbi:MAG: AraC family transcriptional regulator [Gammaproteobacteria bacterium]|nr:AraC family transcriptional regulator [Gammaproteobacteria bacterium]
MKDEIPPKDLLKWLPGKVLTSSEGLGWKDIEQRTYRYTGHDVLLPPIDHFMIVSYQGGHTPMDRRVEDKWRRTYCAPGDLSLLTKSQESHWHWTEDIDVSHVYLSSGLMSRVAADITDYKVENFRLHDLLRAQDDVICRAVYEITKEAKAPGAGCYLYVESLGVQLAIHLLRNYASLDLKSPGGPGRLSSSQAKRLLEYIDDKLQEGLRLDDMAAVVGLGVWTFSRKFNESFNCSPHAFVTLKRIERAKLLLREGKLAIKEIAYMCGFSDQAHMTRVLRAKLGVTPSELKTKHQDCLVKELKPSAKLE